MSDKQSSFENKGDNLETISNASKQPSDRTRFRRVLWITAILIVIAGFLVHVAVQLQVFLQYQVVEVRQPITKQSVFPEVIICMPSYFGNRRNKENKFNGTLTYQEDIFSNNLVKAWKFLLDPDNMDDPKTFQDALHAAQLTFLPLLHKLPVGSTSADTITSCHYDGKTCDYRNFTSFYNNQYGLCFMFRPPNDHLERFQEGIERGLNLNLLVEKSLTDLDKRLMFSTLVAGYRIFIQPHGVWPVFEVPDAIGQVGTQIVTSFKESQLIFLDRPSFSCRPAVKKKLCRLEYKAGLSCDIYEITQATDRLIRYQETLADTCKCISYEWPIPENLRNHPSCHYLNGALYFSADIDPITMTVTTAPGVKIHIDSLVDVNEVRVRSKCYMEVRQKILKNSGRKSKTHWMKSCVENRYDVHVNEYRNPFRAGGSSVRGGQTEIILREELERILKAVNNSNGETTSILQSELDARGRRVKEEGVFLHVFAEKAELEAKQEELNYDGGKFFADLGGLSGVWIGLSALSLLTLIDALIIKVYKYRKNRKSVKFHSSE